MNLASIVVDLKNKTSNIQLQLDIKEYGLKNFSLYLLEFLPKNSNLSYEQNCIKLKQLLDKYLNLLNNNYNIHLMAGKSILGSKDSQATKKLKSKSIVIRNTYLLNKTHSEQIIEQKRNTGFSNPMFGKPVTEANKKLISKLFSKPVFLYDANTFKLISKFNRHMDLVEQLKVSSKTFLKFKDSGKVFRDKYIISTTDIEKIS